MARQSTFTGLGAVLLAAGLVLLLTSVFRSADNHGGALIWVALAALVATIICWFLAARAGDATA